MKSDRDSIKDVWGPRTPFGRGESWPERVDAHQVDEPERWVKSACVLCSTGCALELGVKGDRLVGVRGIGEDRVNRGRLGPKGLHGWRANSSPDRLAHPMIRKKGRLERASWDEALGLVVERSRAIVDRFTPGAVGFYTSGQLMLEEYYTQAIIARAGIGTSHLDGNTRLCTSTASMALIESFGADGAPRRREPGSSGRAPRPSPRAKSASTRTGSSPPGSTPASCTGTTWSPARRWSPTSTARPTPPGGRT